jgi:hypothetical protein
MSGFYREMRGWGKEKRVDRGRKKKRSAVEVNARASWGRSVLRPYMNVTMDRTRRI